MVTTVTPISITIEEIDTFDYLLVYESQYVPRVGEYISLNYDEYKVTSVKWHRDTYRDKDSVKLYVVGA